MASRTLRTGLLSILTLSVLALTFAQSSPPKRRKIKNFGASLKRLKWDPQKNAAIDLAPANSPAEEVDEGDVIRIDTSLVTCELLVVDRQGKNVPDLTANDFLVTENNEPQKVEHFLKGDNVNVPRTIVLIIDYSDSQTPFLKNSIQAAKVMVDKLGPRDLMAIVTDDVELLLDFTNEKKKLKDKLDDLLERATTTRLFGNTKRAKLGRSMQYSALMATLNEAFTAEDIRPIVIFQTDGDEALFLRNPVVTISVPPGLQGEALANAQKEVDNLEKQFREKVREFSLDDLYHVAEKSRATVYTVVPGSKLIGLTPQEQWDKVVHDRQVTIAEILSKMPADPLGRFQTQMQLEQLSRVTPSNTAINARCQSALFGVASLTGGWTEFLEKPEQADAIYARILSDINQRYIVGYYPTNKEHDGKRRKIDFAVKGHPDYQILGRRSYVAPKR